MLASFRVRCAASSSLTALVGVRERIYMNCERARELFSEYLEGELDRAVAEVLRGHIDHCSSCRREFEGLKQAWSLLEALPQVEPPASFRHDVVMRAARIQHQELRPQRNREKWFTWDYVFGRLIPARAIAIACAGAALAVLLLRVPPTAYEQIAGMFNPAPEEISMPQVSANALASSPLSMEIERKQKWQSRKVGRNTVWVTVDRKDNGNGTTLCKVMLELNQDALLYDDNTHRIGAQVYLLPANKFSFEDLSTASPEWQGSILSDQPVVIPVIYDQSQGGSVNILVAWKIRHREFAHVIFIPSNRFSQSRDMFDLSKPSGGFARGGDNLYSALQMIAMEYGVPIVANAYLPNKVSAVSIGQQSLDQELFQTLKPAKLDWLSADGAIYVDKPYEIGQP